MSLARNLSKFKPSSSGLIETADIADDAVSTDQIANNATINTSGAITTTGAFTSKGIDDNADALAITVDSSEKVHLGTASLTSKLNVVGDGNTQGLSIKSGGNGSVHPFQVTWSAGAEGAMLKVDDNGNTHVGIGNLVIGTSGKGIDFSATANTSATGASTDSELLSNYEQGNWTPYFLTGHSYGPAYAEQFGRYVRIGNLINAQYWIRMSGTLHSDGAAVRVAGLPYVLGKSGNENPDSYARGLGSTGFQDYNNNVPVPYGDNGLSTFSLYYDSNTSWSFGSNGSTHGSSGNGKYFIGAITYTVDM